MADVKTMIFDIIAKDGASKTFDKIGKSTDESAKKSGHWKVATAAGLAFVAAAAVEFGKKSVEAYGDAARESMQLARVTGMTVAESSRLRFAAEESGVAFSTLSTSTRLFSKNLGAAGADSKKTAAMVAQLGFNFKDAHGHLLPMSDLLPKVADRFKHMPDGPAKTALAMKLFGRSGADMVKILNKGSEGLKELGAESDRTGNTIANTDALKKQIQAQREFHAAITGLEITIGSLLQPVLTWLAQFLVQHVAPAFSAVAGFVQHNHDLFSKIGPIIGIVVGGFVALVSTLKIFSAVMAAVNVVVDANPFSLIVIAIAAFVAGLVLAWKHSATFRNVVTTSLHAVGAAATWMWNNAFQPALSFIVGGLSKVTGFFAKLVGVIAMIPGPQQHAMQLVAASLDYAASHVQGLADSIKKIPDAHPKVNAAVQGKAAVDALAASIGRLHDKTVVITTATGGHLAVGQVGHGLGANAGGTPFFPGGESVVGEHGPEVVRIARGAQIVSNERGRYSTRDQVTPVIININGALDPLAVAQQVQHALLKLKRVRGGKELGLA